MYIHVIEFHALFNFSSAIYDERLSSTRSYNIAFIVGCPVGCLKVLLLANFVDFLFEKWTWPDSFAKGCEKSVGIGISVFSR